jgi:hypothetical protein
MHVPSPEPNQDAQDLDTLAKAVGLVVLQWSQTEQSLELLVAVLWQSLGGKSFAKRIPKMLETKLEFVRKCAAGTPALAAHRQRIEGLANSFESLSATRHDLIHGAPASIAAVDGAFVFARLEIRDGFHHHHEVRIEAEQYPQLTGRLVQLGKEAHELAASVFSLVKNGGPHVK